MYRADKIENMSISKPPLRIQPTTLWEYPSQHYGDTAQGSAAYKGATPSYVIWNLIKRYTAKRALVVDPMAGSGTTLDVARDLGRRALGYDVNPQRDGIFRVDARKLPLEDGKADFVFIDPPYSTHINYSDDKRCIGKLDAAESGYYEAMEQVISEIHRILKPDSYMGLYVSDSYVNGKGFYPIGFELFAILRKFFEPVDIISVVRHNKTLDMGNYRKAAEEGNFFLRGFNYLFVMHKAADAGKKSPKGVQRSAGKDAGDADSQVTEKKDVTNKTTTRPPKQTKSPVEESPRRKGSQAGRGSSKRPAAGKPARRRSSDASGPKRPPRPRKGGGGRK